MEPTTFANVLATALEQILIARGYAQSRSEKIQFAIPPEQ
jgi:hypothetical protein